jgi:NADH-quinone oxidoreductase subunit M
MLAYSSLNHVGYCLLALFVGFLPGQNAYVGTPGILLQMFNHGLSAAALFYLVGILEARSGGRRGLKDFGGLRSVAPVFAGITGVAMFSSLGLPGLNGFVGEFLIFVSVFRGAPWVAAAATLALLATAIFLLTFYQRVFHGPKGDVAQAGFADLSRREILTLAPLVALMLLLGLWPQALLQLINLWILPVP